MNPITTAAAESLETVLPFRVASLRSHHKFSLAPGRFEELCGAVERLLDGATAALVVFLACRFAGWWHGDPVIASTSRLQAALAAGFGTLVVLLLERFGDYQPCLSLMAIRETERLLRTSLAALIIALPVSVSLTARLPLTAVVLAAAALPAALAVEKWLSLGCFRSLQLWLGAVQKTLLVGTGPLARRLYSSLAKSPKLGLDPVGLIEVEEFADAGANVGSACQQTVRDNVLPGPVTAATIRRLAVRVVIVATAGLSGDEIAQIRREAELAGANLCVIPEPFPEYDAETDYLELDGMLLAYRNQGCEHQVYAICKRALDVIVAAISLMVLSPLLAATAVAIKLTSAGPAIFRQERVGRDGRVFVILKFRSMYVESAKYAVSPVSGRDPRITPIGRVLRHLCIDEMPQLLNVLRGDMSLVGPRPEMPFIVQQYNALHGRRLRLKPGITGLWQLSADRRYPIHHNISYDLYYARHRNLLLDVAILLHTAVFAFRGV